MTSMAAALGYGWAVDLSNPAWVHELRDPHTGKWIDSPGDVTFPLPEPGPAGGADRYKVPDPARLREVKSGYRNPADHPFWREHPVSPDNIVAAYDASDAGTREQGRRWYSDVSDLASKIAGGDAEKGGILLSTYSPQTTWPVNMFNAARSAERGKAIGPGEGMMVTAQQQEKAQRALDGEGIETLMTTAKTHSFGALIAHGDDLPTDPYGHVVVDTHAVNVALGGTMRGKALEKAPIGDARQHEYVADQYRQAAKIISEREGKLMKPHQLQAITWLAQQRANQGLDAAQMTPLQKGRVTMTKNAWKRWITYADEQGIPVVIGSTGIEMAYQALLADVIELLGGDSIWAQLAGADQVIELDFNPAEARDDKGRWTHMPGAGIGKLGELQIPPGVKRKRSRERPVITAAEARGNSRPVSHDEFQHLAALGNSWIDKAKRDASPVTGLDRNWAKIKSDSYAEARKPWGGATIDSHTGVPLASDADKYAISVKPKGMDTVSVPETASHDEFSAAMDRALAQFRPVLERQSFHLGVFHDDEHQRIDIDPVAIVDSLPLVEQVGAYTRAIGGAYHFKSGDGFWPPHVAEGAGMANDDSTVHFAGPGQWHSQAVAIQDPEPDDAPDEG
jgi:hypothetical protein